MGEAKRRRRQAQQRLASVAGQVRRESPPEPYSHMTAGQYWGMLEGEDPDDRAIREAHGIGYEEDYRDLSIMCYGCGATYFDIAVDKRRACAAADKPNAEAGHD